jgi:uncharacterized protein YggE
MLSVGLLFIAAGAALLTGIPAFSFGPEDRGARTDRPVLRVVGEAEVGVEPDLVTFEVGAAIRDASASKAMSDVAKITERLLAALRSAEIPRENIRTTQLALNEVQVPVPGHKGEAGEYRRAYEATHALRAALDREQFDHLGEILDAALRVGATFVEGITFKVRDEVALQREGLMEAVKDAHSKAEVMAAAANVPLLGLVSITEGRASDPSDPFLHARWDMTLSSAPAPVSPSTIHRAYTVIVEYAVGS